MPNHLDIPSELASLIEKRELEDRRQQKKADQGSDSEQADQQLEERRAAKNRRSS